MLNKTFAVSMCLIILAAAPVRGDEKTTPTRKISTSGRGEIQVVPDKITVTFGVSSRNKNLDLAKKDNDERTAKVLALADKFGLDAKQVQTSSMEIEPHYKSNYADVGAGEFIAYSVSKKIVFVLAKTEHLTSLVSEALESGANTIDGVEFGTTELRKHKDQARVLAIRAAREKAELLANTLGMSVGFPLTIIEERERWSGSANRNEVAFGYCGAEEESSEPPTFALGLISVAAEVSVEFEMTPMVDKPQSTQAPSNAKTQGNAAAASANAAVTTTARTREERNRFLKQHTVSEMGIDSHHPSNATR